MAYCADRRNRTLHGVAGMQPKIGFACRKEQSRLVG